MAEVRLKLLQKFLIRNVCCHRDIVKYIYQKYLQLKISTLKTVLGNGLLGGGEFMVSKNSLFNISSDLNVAPINALKSHVITLALLINYFARGTYLTPLALESVLLPSTTSLIECGV